MRNDHEPSTLNPLDCDACESARERDYLVDAQHAAAVGVNRCRQLDTGSRTD